MILAGRTLVLPSERSGRKLQQYGPVPAPAPSPMDSISYLIVASTSLQPTSRIHDHGKYPDLAFVAWCCLQCSLFCPGLYPLFHHLSCLTRHAVIARDANVLPKLQQFTVVILMQLSHQCQACVSSCSHSAQHQPLHLFLPHLPPCRHCLVGSFKLHLGLHLCLHLQKAEGSWRRSRPLPLRQ